MHIFFVLCVIFDRFTSNLLISFGFCVERGIQEYLRLIGQRLSFCGNELTIFLLRVAYLQLLHRTDRSSIQIILAMFIEIFFILVR